MAFIQKINQSIGLNLEMVKSLRTRKGFACQVTDGDKPMLLKIIELKLDDADAVKRKRSLQKEAQLLRELSPITNHIYVNSGEIDDHFWLLRRWIEGKTAFAHTSYIRSEPQSREKKVKFLQDVMAMLHKVTELYDYGYLHGDLQPSHFIFNPAGNVSLIDLELAVKVDDTNPSYRGALVHFVPPDTAQGMLERDEKIPLDQVSEIYSFGAVVFYLYTGVVPVAYGDSMEDPGYDFPFEQMLSAVVKGRVRSFAQAGAKPFPELERIVMKCLAPRRQQRFQCFAELRLALEKSLTDLQNLA